MDDGWMGRLRPRTKLSVPNGKPPHGTCHTASIAACESNAPRHVTPIVPPAVDGAHVLVKRGMGDEDEIDAVAIVVEVIDVLHLAADVQVDRAARGAALVVVVVHRDDGHDAMPACHERLSIDVRRGSDGEREGARRQTKEGWIEGKGRSGERQDLICGQDGRATARRAAESFFNHAAGGRGPWGGMP